MRYFFLAITLLTSLHLVSCGKKPADVAPSQQAAPKRETPATTPQELAPITKPATAVSLPKPEPYAGLEIPNPPVPPKISRIEKYKVIWGIVDKTLPEVVEYLGYPAIKKTHERTYYPDGWLYEWPIVIVDKSPDGQGTIEIPKIGVFFKDEDSTATNIYINEYLTNAIR